jgi:uncharacterized protein
MASLLRRLQGIFVPMALALPISAAAQPKPSFDCTRASSPVDKLICSNGDIAELDRGLADRYAQMRRELTPEGYAVLHKSQLNWLTSRSSCTAELKAGQPELKDTAAGCLANMYRDRVHDLGLQFKTTGSLSLEGREIVRKVPKLQVAEVDDYPVLVGNPRTQVLAFNRYIYRRLNLGTGMFAASGIKLDPKLSGETTFSRGYEIRRFDARMISIEIFESHESYFGHGWRSEYALSWDLERGEPARIANVFRPDQSWQQAVVDYALKYIHEHDDIQDPESFVRPEDVEDDDVWLFDEDGAVLLLGHGERSMVGASDDVPIPYEFLAPYLAPTTPLLTRGKQ